MTWLLIPFRILSAGLLRFADGSSLDFPRVITTALIGLTSLWAAYDASTDWIVSVLVGVASAITIQAGYTSWENLKHQCVRGLLGPVIIAFGVIFLESYIAPLNFAGIILLHVSAFAMYYGVDKVKLPLISWEQLCRILQGAFICGAASLV